MQEFRSLDALVRTRLRQWPQRPPGLAGPRTGRDGWLRGRPTETHKPLPPVPETARQRPAAHPARRAVAEFRRHAGGTLCGYPRHRSLRLTAEPARQALPLRALHPLAAGGLPGALAARPGHRQRPDAALAGHRRAAPRTDHAAHPAGARRPRDVRAEAQPLPRFRRFPGAAPARILRADGHADRRSRHEDPRLQALLARATARANFL